MVEINDESWGAYNDNDNNNNNDIINNNNNNNNNKNDSNNNIKFKASIIRSSLCDYSAAYILVKGAVKVPNTAAEDVAVNNTYKTVILKNCAPFTSCIIEINSIQVDYAKYIDIVMPLYNLIECSNAFQRHRKFMAIL